MKPLTPVSVVPVSISMMGPEGIMSVKQGGPEEINESLHPRSHIQ